MFKRVNQSHAHAGRDVIGRDSNNYIFNFPDSGLANDAINAELSRIIKKRHFNEFDRIAASKRLAENCLSGSFASGHDEVRAKALAWCARIHSIENTEKASEFLSNAKDLADLRDIHIADAFLISRQSGKANALKKLADIDHPSAKSASLGIVVQHDELAGALRWYETVGLKPEDFDASGKNLLLSGFLDSDNLSEATKLISKCNESDFEEAPILLLTVATATLLLIVPPEYRPVTMTQPPFEMSSFDLASDPRSLDIHRDSAMRYEKARDAYRQLDLPLAAQTAEGYRTWLSLSHPDLKSAAQDELRTKIHDPKGALEFVPYALSYGISMDLDAVEREIDRQVALNGGATSDTAVARLALALTKNNPHAVARYVELYRSELIEHIDPRALAFLEIEMQAKSGQIEQARETLLNLSEHINLNEEEEVRLNLIISTASSDDPTEERRLQFEKSDQLTDLKVLVDALERDKDWNKLATYAEKLHARTKSLISAEQFASALIKTGKEPSLLNFLEENKGFLKQSQELRTIHCWALYRSGRIIDAKEAVKSAAPETTYENSYSLRRNIAIASGEWHSLNTILAEELDLVDERSAKQLLQSAYLGFQINAPVAKDLLFAAAKRAEDSPDVLAEAYFLATNAGLENDEEVAGWLHSAARLSGSSGPIQNTSIEEIIERQPDWNRQQKNTIKLLREAKVPMFIAAQSLNRSLVELTLTQYLTNQRETDPRARAAIPAFSGKRYKPEIPLPNCVGVDPTALLTLGVLDALDIFESWDMTLKIPHSTLEWLFLERQRSAFHQPSRISRAQNIQDMYVNGQLEALQQTSPPDAKLIAAVGEDLAALITEAHQIEATATQTGKFVVRSAPVHRIGSFLKEPLNLSEHKSILVSCQAVIEALTSQGRITAQGAKKANSFLQINEQRWGSEPQIEPGSTLFLDSLSVVYFQDCDLLEKLGTSGFRIIVSKDTLSEVRALLAFRQVSEQVQEVIERIRSFLQNGIASGNVILDPLTLIDDSDDDYEFQNHPTFQALKIAGGVDAIIFDDRFINQHNHLSAKPEINIPLITTLELLEMLKNDGGLEPSRYYHAKHLLNCGGYLLAEPEPEEIYDHLANCQVVSGVVQENAQLRSLRENIALARISSFLQPETETVWLERFSLSMINVYRRVWSSDEQLEDISAKALWLLELIDLRGWLHCFPQEQANHILNKGRALHFPLLISAPPELDEMRQTYFLEWVDTQLMHPLKVQFPSLFDVIIEDQKKILLEMLDNKEALSMQENGGKG